MITERSLEAWHEFGCAVAHVVEVERPDLTVWDALSEALLAWSGSEARIGGTGGDPLRAVLDHLLCTTAEMGAPSGVAIAEIMEAAISTWSSQIADDLNNGHCYGTSCTLVVAAGA